MQNVKIVKAGKIGYFLTIGDDVTKHRWAVTAFELIILLRTLKDMEKELFEEMEKDHGVEE